MSLQKMCVALPWAEDLGTRMQISDFFFHICFLGPVLLCVYIAKQPTRLPTLHKTLGRHPKILGPE